MDGRCRVAGGLVNLLSPQELAGLLFDDLHLPWDCDRGKPNTNAEVEMRVLCANVCFCFYIVWRK